MVLNSQDPNNPRATAGVTFVVNKALISPRELSMSELIKGHAQSLKIKWRENEEAVLINIYALNNRNEHRDFWGQLEAKICSQNIRRPDFLMGDFNVTEDPIDRAPAHPDDLNAIEALRNLRHSLDLQDSWRHAYPHDRNFTYHANNNGQQIKSHLDRIYTSSTAAKHTFDWKSCQTAVPTDHWLVMTKFTPADAPYIRKGRWMLQLPALENKDLIDEAEKRGIKLQEDLNKIENENTNREIANPQTLWKVYKQDVTDIAKKRCRESRAKISMRIELLKKDLHQIMNHPNIDTDESVCINEAFLASELAHLEKT